MYSKRKILIFIDWFLPGFKAGGPIQSVANLVNSLSDKYEFYIVTSNKDLGEVEPYKDTIFNEWINFDNYKVIYLDRKYQTFSIYKKIFKEQAYSTVYFNSMFSWKFTILPILAARKFQFKKILAPRGMLGYGAIKINKLKKISYLKLMRLVGIFQHFNWHATSNSEVKEIVGYFGNSQRMYNVPNLTVPISTKFIRKYKVKNEINLFFLSRISPKKNLLGALTILNKIDNSKKVNFRIMGPVDDQIYWEKCLKFIEELPKNVKVEYLGAIPHNNIGDTLRDQHVLFLPTEHENYGHVIIECLSASCLVLISQNTPWRTLSEQKVGWDINLLKLDDFVKVINYVTSFDQEEFDDWSERAFNYAMKYLGNSDVLIEAEKIFE